MIDLAKYNKIIREICKKNDITFLGLFGSTARGDEKSASDVDLMVRFTERKSLLDIVRIEREFTEAVGTEVDLLMEASIHKYLKKQILSDLKVIYDN